MTRSELVETLAQIRKSNHPFTVVFRKRGNGELRTMNCVFRSNDASRTKGGQWANGNAGKRSDHGLIGVTDRDINEYRAFPVDSVTELHYNGVHLIED